MPPKYQGRDFTAWTFLTERNHGMPCMSRDRNGCFQPSRCEQNPPPPPGAKDLRFHQQALHPLFRSFFQNSQLHLVTPLTVVQLVMDVFWFRQNANSCRCKIMIMSCIRINTYFSFTTSISNKPVSACIVAHRYRNSMISRKNIKYLSFHQASNSWNPVNSVCFPLRKKLSFERGNVTTTYKSPRYLDFATQNHGKMPSKSGLVA